jgi:hypothetical protein
MSDRALCGYPEQLVDDPVLGEDISFGHPPKLPFAGHVHDFITLDGPLRCGKRATPQPRVHPAFHKPVVLFYRIIQILTLSK